MFKNLNMNAQFKKRILSKLKIETGNANENNAGA